ncbi:hypothetical protein [Brevibacterium senegalense]|uniref:hypothetical protein n=1 Tax=Brevibacterium senegalense TaxID=1033736 RepID=UPI0002D31DA8|nr:hypothetical protein [Brevibacterium senegalense]
MTLAPAGWQRTDAATEVVEDTLWIAPLPHGPVIRLEGMAVILLEQFREPTPIAEAVDACMSLVDDAPDDAPDQLRSAVDGFIDAGLLSPVHTTPPRTLSL